MSDEQPQAPTHVEPSLSADQIDSEAVAVQEFTEQPEPQARLRFAWQIPLLLVSVGLIGLGLWELRTPAVPADDPAALLAAATEQMDAGQYEQARQLQQQASMLIDPEDASLRSELLVGRADLEARRPFGRRDHARILKHYDLALELGRELEVEQHARRAAALAGTGAHEEAYAILLDGVGADSLERIRARVLETLVEQALQGRSDVGATLAPALDRYAAEPGRALERSAWAALASARIRLAAGDHEVGIDALQRSMRRLDVSESAPLGGDWKARMYSVYGLFWLELGDRDAARGPLEVALEELVIGDEDRRKAAAGLAWIDFADGQHDAAIERFDEIIASNPEVSTMEQVRLWRAEAHAALGAYDVASRDYMILLDRFTQVGDHFARRLLESVGDRVRELLAVADPGRAVLFAELVVDTDIFGFNEELLVFAAGAHRTLGETILRSHADGEDLMSIPAGVVPEQDRRLASTHFRRAGELFELVANHHRADPDDRRVWVRMQRAAAESYDLGADPSRTLEAYRLYLQSTTAEDLERAHVAYRYARVLHASGRFQDALEAYDDLVRTHESMPDAANKARVDAARCLMVLGRVQEARARLESIVSGQVGGLYPDSIGFREAKFLLGRLYSTAGDWTNAIGTLNEVLRRYSDDPQVPEAAFLLAHAHRESSGVLDEELLDGSLTPSRRRHLDERRAAHLREAGAAYARVVDAYTGREAGSLEPVEFERLRDAAVARADCAFRLGLDEEAVVLYEALERRYRKEAISLGALIRLVEIWDRLGNAGMADKAHRQAELRLRQLPESAFAFPDSNFDRESWRVWIERRPLRGMRVEAGE